MLFGPVAITGSQRLIERCGLAHDAGPRHALRPQLSAADEGAVFHTEERARPEVRLRGLANLGRLRCRCPGSAIPTQPGSQRSITA